MQTVAAWGLYKDLVFITEFRSWDVGFMYKQHPRNTKYDNDKRQSEARLRRDSHCAMAQLARFLGSVDVLVRFWGDPRR